MEGMIKLTDALNIMASYDSKGNPLPFSFKMVTCNLREGTGGEHREYTDAYLPSCGNSSKDSRKNPRNWANVTRTVQVPGKGRPITVHALTIIEFNGETVYI